MSPHNFTELFFLDEATAFAAGHRPCCECRRERYIEFKDYWVKANLKMQASEVKASVINKILQKDRIYKGIKTTYKTKLKELPDCTIFTSNNLAYMIFEGMLYLWSFKGYSLQKNINLPDKVEALTPKTIVNAFRLGFKPEVHESVFS